MKCPSCKTKLGSADYRNDPWAKIDKNGEGYYLCPSCEKALVHRWTIGPSILLFVFVAVPISEALVFLATVTITSILGFGEPESEFVRFGCYALVVTAVCLYSIQPVEVSTD